MDNLFELPDPDLRMPGLRIGAPPRDYFTADQLRACVLAAIQAEREACAKLCESMAYALDYGGNPYTRERHAQKLASQIRARGKS